jgi:hypothetical protein
VRSLLVSLALLLAASTAFAANICDMQFGASPATVQEAAEAIATANANDSVIISAGLVRHMVQQAMEDVCFDEGIVLPPVAATPGCDAVKVNITFNGGYSVRLLKTAEDADVYLTNIKGLERLLTLPARDPERFCRVATRNVVRAAAPAPADSCDVGEVPGEELPDGCEPETNPTTPPAF